MFTPIDSITLAEGVTMRLHRETPAYVARLLDAERDRLGIEDGAQASTGAQLDLMTHCVAVAALEIESDHHVIEWPPLPRDADPLHAHTILTARRAIVAHMPPAMLGRAFAAVMERMGVSRDEGNGSGAPSVTSGGSAPTPPA